MTSQLLIATNDRRLAAGEEPALGSHLVTPRLGFTHHGIYVGVRQGRPLRRLGTWASRRPGGRRCSRAVHSWTHSLGSTRYGPLRL